MTHSFDVELAKEVGIEKALILKELQNLIEYKSNNQLDIRDGRAWVYYSSQALAKKFPYMKASSIRRWMDELEDDGYIESGFFSSDKRDRVKWYHIKSMSDCIDQNEQCSIDQNEQCNIYDTTLSEYTTQTKDNTHTFDSACKNKNTIGFDTFWQEYPVHVNKKKAMSIYAKLSDNDKSELLGRLSSWLAYKPFESYRPPNPDTFLRNRRWEDEVPTSGKPVKTEVDNDPRNQW